MVSVTRSTVISVSIVTADWSMPAIEFHHRLDRRVLSSPSRSSPEPMRPGKEAVP
jgi:hypothetical protein